MCQLVQGQVQPVPLPANAYRSGYSCLSVLTLAPVLMLTDRCCSLAWPSPFHSPTLVLTGGYQDLGDSLAHLFLLLWTWASALA